MMSQFRLNQTLQQDILCIRHGRSQFNQGQIQFFNANTHLQYPEAQDDRLFCETVLFSPKYIDFPLSEEGVVQCLKQRQNPKLFQTQLVLVSPLLRALQTAKLIFEQNKIPFVVLPQLTQAFRYGCDLCTNLEQKKQRFSQMDFTRMKHYGTHWYIQKLLSHKNKKMFENIIKRNPYMSLSQRQQIICKMVAKKQLYESSEELRTRVNIVKKTLQHYRKSYEKITVVSHSWILRYMLTTHFDHNHYPIHLPAVQNATPIWVSLAKLLAHL